MFIVALYAWQEKDTLQLASMFVYAGGAIGAVLAGDLLTLFIFWEITAVSSALLIWANRTTGAIRAGQRYFIIHVGSGLFLLAGSILHYKTTGSLAFDHIGIDSLAGWLILIAFAIKCAFPLLHNWLQDSYPGSQCSRHRCTVGVHYKTCHLCISTRLSRHRNVDLDWRHYDCLPHIFCCN